MGEFQDALVEVRLSSAYPNSDDLTRALGMPGRTYRHWETGDRYPSAESLEKLIRYLAVPKAKADELRLLHRKEKLIRSGVEVEIRPVEVDVSALSDKIQREVEYELRRAGIKMTPRSRKVCIRRITMILNDALGES